MLKGLPNDCLFTLRVLRRAPGFALLVIATLAIGIGANTAVFSLLYQVLLRPLPYPNADRIVALYETKAPNDFGSESALAPGNIPTSYLLKAA